MATAPELTSATWDPARRSAAMSAASASNRSGRGPEPSRAMSWAEPTLITTRRAAAIS